MKFNIILDEGARIPASAHKEDAGYDLFARETKVVPARGSARFDTGVHIQIPEGYAVFLKSKSGLNVKHGIISDGLVDSGYTGSIVAKLYNLSDEPYIVKEGDKITQIVFQKIEKPTFEEVEEFEETERGNGGFGSSGRA
jgi:dUTP pyrophosphatase